jgi:hypothetical protein
MADGGSNPPPFRQFIKKLFFMIEKYNLDWLVFFLQMV